jgi:hypothetical protein
MKPFLLFGLLAASALAVAPARADDAPKHHEAMMACAKACAACQLECDSCLAHCKHLLSEGKKEHAPTAQSCGDCAAFCVLAARLTARTSPHSGLACEACAKMCDDCAAACEKHPNDEHMAKCAKECRTCAKACREMLEHAKQ